MRRVVVFGVLVLLVVGVGWRLRCRDRDGGDNDSTIGSGGKSAATSAHRRARGERAQPAALSGRVTRAANGTGIAGAVVSFAPAKFADEFAGEDQPTTIAITDGDGKWQTAVAPGTYQLAASASGFIPATRDRFTVSEAARETVDLALVAGGVTVSGTISDIGGGPIGGARVVARSDQRFFDATSELTAIAAADGRYQLTLGEGSYRVTASHDDYVSDRKSIDIKERDPSITLDFALVPGGQIRGQVVTSDGTPVPHAMVVPRAERHRERRPTVADDAGNFVVRGLPPGIIKLTATAPKLGTSTPTIVALAIGEQVTGVRLVLERKPTVSGRVVRAGKPSEGVPGVRVGLFTIGGGQFAAIDPTADDGSFEIDGVDPGSYMIFAFGEHTVAEIGKPIEVPDHDLTDVVVEIALGATLAGRVEPPGVATLSLAMPTDKIGMDNLWDLVKVTLVHGESDATGAFTIRAAPAGKFKLVARTRAGAFGELPVEITDVDQTGLVIALKQRASIAGKVVDTTGAPVAGVRVRAAAKRTIGDAVTVEPGRDRDSDESATDGSFRISGLAAATYDVYTFEQAVAPESGSMVVRHEASDNPSKQVELGDGQAVTGVVLTVAARDGTIRGTIVDRDNKPVADAWVSVAGQGDYFETTTPPALSGPDGKFSFTRLRRGKYRIEVEGPRGNSRATKDDVKTGDTVTITVEALGSLAGKVTIGNAPVTSFDITCDRKGDHQSENITGRRHFASATGTYQLERMTPGDYECAIDADAGNQQATVTVTSGSATHDFALVGWATISGTVVSITDGKPVPGIYALAGAADDSDLMSGLFFGRAPKTDASGRFTVERVRPGKVKFVVSSGTFTQEPLAKRDITLAAGERFDAGTIKIVPPRGPDAGTLGFTTAIDDDKLVVGVVKQDGPAAAAGVVEGDRVVAINGTPVAQLGADAAHQLIAPGNLAIGQRVQLGLERAGKPVAATVVAVKW